MAEDAVDDARACVERNQRLIDALLTRRVHDERRCDLYQRIQQAQDAKRRQLEIATIAVQKELLQTLEKLYILDQKRGRGGELLLASTKQNPPSSSSSFDAAEELRVSISETQRFNEGLRMAIIHHASSCDALKQTAQDKEVRCCELQDLITSERVRDTRAAAASSADVSSARPSHATDLRDVTAEVGTFVEALLMDATQFYQRAFGVARDDVVDYIALQDEFYSRVCRSPAHAVTATSFEASLTNSVQLFLNTYTQLRRQEQQRYQEILLTLTRLLRESKVQR